jgi:hypothetical protein
MYNCACIYCLTSLWMELPFRTRSGRVSKPSQRLQGFVGVNEISNTARRAEPAQSALPDQDPVKAQELVTPVQMNLDTQPQDAFGDQLSTLCASCPPRTSSAQTTDSIPARCATDGSMDLEALNQFADGVFAQTCSDLLEDVSRASSTGSGPIRPLVPSDFGMWAECPCDLYLKDVKKN